MIKNIALFIINCSLFIVLASSCGQGSQKKQETEEPASTPAEETRTLAPLEAGEAFYKKQNPFGDDVHLTGKQILGDTIIFKPREIQLLVKDGMVVTKNLANEMFMQFNLEDLKFVRYGKGFRGNGPDEFMFPSLVPTPDTTILCYVYEMTNRKLYKYHKNGDLTYYPFAIMDAKEKTFTEPCVVNIAPDTFLYVTNSPTGKSIFKASARGDSAIVEEIFNLGLNPKRKSWAAYIGDFVVNPELNRMAYAYKYFKIIKFMDLEAKTVRTINFERESFDESTLYKVDGLDNNVTHYWGACAGKDYVYFMYSGRKPYDVAKENDKGIHYIFVEQYDWNGNPVCRYKLDHWGRFTVDEANRRFIQVSTNDDDPFFLFDLPETISN